MGDQTNIVERLFKVLLGFDVKQKVARLFCYCLKLVALLDKVIGLKWLNKLFLRFIFKTQKTDFFLFNVIVLNCLQRSSKFFEILEMFNFYNSNALHIHWFFTFPFSISYLFIGFHFYYFVLFLFYHSVLIFA